MRAFALIIIAVASLITTSAHADPGTVVINGHTLAPMEVQALAGTLGMQPVPGRYWYDARCGAWGVEGQGALGVLPAGLPVRGRLNANASNGRLGVFVNGRQLTGREVQQLRRLGPVYRGRYWLDARGTFGLEGGPALGNMAAAAKPRGGRSTHWRSKNTDIGVGTDGNGGVYIMGDGFSYSNF